MTIELMNRDKAIAVLQETSVAMTAMVKVILQMQANIAMVTASIAGDLDAKPASKSAVLADAKPQVQQPLAVVLQPKVIPEQRIAPEPTPRVAPSASSLAASKTIEALDNLKTTVLASRDQARAAAGLPIKMTDQFSRADLEFGKYTALIFSPSAHYLGRGFFVPKMMVNRLVTVMPGQRTISVSNAIDDPATISGYYDSGNEFVAKLVNYILVYQYITPPVSAESQTLASMPIIFERTTNGLMHVEPTPDVVNNIFAETMLAFIG